MLVRSIRRIKQNQRQIHHSNILRIKPVDSIICRFYIVFKEYMIALKTLTINRITK